MARTESPIASLGSAARYLPENPEKLSLSALRKRAAHCEACPLYRRATQTVFGLGMAPARLMLVGEQPGDQEDRQGKPFVGPAGRLLDEALQAAGIDRGDTYVTNAVKHFKWEPKGKWRLHKKPNSREIAACQPWLEAELAVVKPAVLVLLGATAAQALLGKDFLVTRRRGQLLRDTPWAPAVVVTIHPSSILRGPPEERARALAAFVKDLAVAHRALAR
jgi:DNA polymerase